MRGAHCVVKRLRALAQQRYFTEAALAVWLFCSLSGAAAQGQTSAQGDGQHAAKYASAYNWIQSPAMPPALVAGANTITLRPCPRGLRVADPPGLVSRVAPHEYVYVAGTGEPEAALIAGGGGHAGEASCTIDVTLKQPHPAATAQVRRPAASRRLRKMRCFLPSLMAEVSAAGKAEWSSWIPRVLPTRFMRRYTSRPAIN